MKKVITLILLIFSLFVDEGVAQSDAKSDTIKVYFALNKATYDPALDNNAALMNQFIDGILVAANSGALDHIIVYGYSSPEGPFPNNDKLSIKRCNVIADYISQHTGIPSDQIQAFPSGVAWDGLRSLVIGNENIPTRDSVINILDKYLPDSCTDQTLSDQCIKSLIAIDVGLTYDWMLKNLFPRLRYSMAVYTHLPPPNQLPKNQILKYSDDNTPDIQMISVDDFAVSQPLSIELSSIPYESFYRFAVKTNLLYYAALMPNIELEWLINDNWSVAIDGNIAWWGNYSNNKSYRILIISPEISRWIRPRAPWHGLYVGAFTGGGIYDFQNGGDGYRGEGAMGGLSVGYMWPLNNRLSLEAEIGAGYLYTRYKQYYPFEGHHIYKRTKEINYFGPLKAKFSIVWRFFDTAKPKKNNPLQ